MLVSEGAQFQSLPMEPPPCQPLGMGVTKGKRSHRSRHTHHAYEEEVKEMSTPLSERNQIGSESPVMEEDSYDVFMGALSLMSLSLPELRVPDWLLDCPQNPQSAHSPHTDTRLGKLQRRKRIRTKKLQEAIDLEFDDGYAEPIKKMYSCKTCSRKFSSFQALGGHRASCYNKLKSMNDDEDEDQIQIQQKGFHTIEEDAEDNITEEDPPRHYRYYSFSSNKHSFGIHGEADIRKDKVHKCPVCYKVFSSGQALGGHKRCHNSSPPGTLEANTTTSSVSTIDQIQIRPALDLDLNMPAPLDDYDNCIPMKRYLRPEITRKSGWLHGDSTSLPKEDEADSKVGFNTGKGSQGFKLLGGISSN